VFSVQDERVEALRAEHLDAPDRILGFATVGSDVLDGCGPDFAGDEREILQSPQFVLHGPFDQVVPLDARVGFDRHAVRLFVHDADTLCHRGQQCAGIVLREEDVVASAEDVPRIRHPFLEEFLQIFRPVELDEACRSLRHVKTVARGEFGIVKFSYHICKVRNYFVNLNVFDKRGQNDFTRSAGRRKQRM
jgi:hypothetical protein